MAPKPSPVQKTPPGTALICAVCKKPFRRPPNLAVKAKVCTSKGVVHKTRWEKQPDGSAKKIACGCCLCVYKRTLAKNRSLDGKIIPKDKVAPLLQKTREMYGQLTSLAFRLGLNAMLRVRELASLQVTDLRTDTKPAKIEVVALKKKVEMRFPVDIGPDMVRDLKPVIGKRTSGNLFETSKRTFQERFKAVARAIGLDGLSIHSLRHTGISNRARAVTNFEEENYLGNQARHNSIETTRLYLGYEVKQRLSMVKKIKWF